MKPPASESKIGELPLVYWASNAAGRCGWCKDGLRPDGPPLVLVQGIGRIFTSPEAIRKALSFSDSPSHGLTFCQGNYVTMNEDVESLIYELVKGKKYSLCI